MCLIDTNNGYMLLSRRLVSMSKLLVHGTPSLTAVKCEVQMLLIIFEWLFCYLSIALACFDVSCKWRKRVTLQIKIHDAHPHPESISEIQRDLYAKVHDSAHAEHAPIVRFEVNQPTL